MVVQKRLDYGFNGYQVPAMPRATRSARVRGSFKRKVEDNHMCAFELLATVAGKLLLERESSPAPISVSAERAQRTIVKDIIKEEQEEEEKPLKLVPCDKGICDKSVFVSEPGLQVHSQDYILKEFSHAQNDALSGPASVIVSSNISEKVGCIDESEIGKCRSEFGLFPSKTEGHCSGCGESYKDKVEDGIKRQVEAEPQKNFSVINETVPDTCSLGDPMELEIKPPVQVSSDGSVEVPLCRDTIPRGPFPRCQDDLKVDSRDDDENSSGCTQPCTITTKALRALPRTGDRRIRKLLTSRYWKVALKLKDRELSNYDGDMKPVFSNRNARYTHQRSQRNSPFKRRKQFKQRSRSTSDRGISSKVISSSPEKDINTIAIGSGATKHRASGASSSVDSQESSLESRDSHVKLSIKSFRVPELFIEIPETATVGSLKRTVMEAVTTIFDEGLCVGLLLQGKKVRDDNKTLLQTGICDDDKLESLGFSLEPNTASTSPPICPKDPPFLCARDTPQPSTSYPTTPMTNLGNCVKSDHDSVPTPTDMSMDKIIPDSRDLVVVPAMSVEALTVVPLHQKSRRSELAQRRIRRPFSVSEVEALVQAVENLGTGRWRDIKLCAFDNANHRTFVDLKDKWKTLVHTARISPQQRRGEPVPQELLDRVLSAHAYWSQHRRRQHVKQQTELCLQFNGTATDVEIHITDH